MASSDTTQALYNSPLRYPGGKGQLLGYVKRILLDNHLSGGHYAEPYAGGASVALGLLFDEVVVKIHINDLDRHIWSFWASVLNDTDALCAKIKATDITVEEWNKQRTIFQHETEYSVLDVGFSTFFLNRVNRSGILRGGVIGGKEQKGTWKLDARFNKSELIARIVRIAKYRSRIALYNLDAEDFLRDIVSTLAAKSLTYLDPPYYVKGQDLYTNFYQQADHARIASIMKTFAKPWIISYDWHKEINRLYASYKSIVYKLNYSAQDRYQGSEVMIFSDQLVIPDVEDPRKVKRAQSQATLL